MTAAGFSYEGSELALFADAVRWKRYYARSLSPFLGPAVLEVGAGIGGTTEILCSRPHLRWVCVEPDAALAAELEARIQGGALPPFCECRVGTLSSIREDERFDTVLYIDVLEHIERDRDELARALLRLNPGGHLIVLAPAHAWLWSPFDAAVGHCRRYTRASLLALGPAGARAVRVRHLDAVGLFASLANRLLLRSALPTAAQIRLWDRGMVPLSRVVDPLFGYRVGKTIVVVWQRT
jgi:2-polyprenyl-3-methyl-5-hydroxy-6-metoxy-1,4-benzoquinol methylase